MDSLATAAIISEDPHAVLVEFSSVVADTQEYIIKVRVTGELGKEKVYTSQLQGAYEGKILWVQTPVFTSQSVTEQQVFSICSQ